MTGEKPSSWKMPPGQVRRRQEIFLHFAIAAILFGLVFLVYSTFLPIHHDLAGSALSGDLALTLGTNYDNYSLYFPPAERFWFSLAAWIHAVSGLKLELVVILMTCAAIFISAELGYIIRRKTNGATFSFLIISMCAFIALPLVFKNVFGLREHLVVLGMWPYLVLRISDPKSLHTGVLIRTAVGVWMGWALLFKYLYAMLVLLIEVADSVLQRRFLTLLRLENILSGSIVFLYLVFWLGVSADNREAIGVMASAINANLHSFEETALRIGLKLSIGLLILIGARVNGASTRQIVIGFIVILGTILVAATQGRWYTHHEFPIFMGYILWLWILSGVISKLFKFAICFLLFFMAANEFIAINSYRSVVAAVHDTLNREEISLAGKRVGVLTMHPSPFNQVILEQGGHRWTPMMNIAYVPAEVQELDRIENHGVQIPPLEISDPGRAALHDQMLRLWEDYPPELLILDNARAWPIEYLTLDWKHVLSKDERFNSIIQNYELLNSFAEANLRYEIYRRKY